MMLGLAVGGLAGLAAGLTIPEVGVDSTKYELSSTQNELTSTKNELSSTRDNLRVANQKVEELKKDNLGLQIIINKLFEVGKLQEQVFSNKVEGLLSKFDLEVSQKEEEKLKEQLSNYRKLEEDVVIKLQKIMEIENQVLNVNEELLSTRSSLETSKIEEDMLKQQLVDQEKFQKDVQMKLEMIMKLEKQISDAKIEASSLKDDFEALKNEEKLVKEQLQSCENFHQVMEMKLQKVIELEKQLSFIRAETLLAKASLEASRKQEERLKKQLSEYERQQQDMEIKLQKVLELDKELSLYETEALSAIASLEASIIEEDKLKEKLSSLEKFQQVVLELNMLQNI